jgi:hypothetical protein
VWQWTGCSWLAVGGMGSLSGLEERTRVRMHGDDVVWAMFGRTERAGALWVDAREDW